MQKSEPILKERSMGDSQFRSRMIFSFALFLLLAFGAWKGYEWINHQPKDGGTLKPLRKVLGFNEKVFSTVFDSNKLVKEYPLSAAAKKVRVNGLDGLRDSVNVNTWRLQVVRSVGDTLQLPLMT